MIEKVNEIRKAIKYKCYLPAMALALTLPDICGEIEYPEEHAVGKRYKAWFDKWVSSSYECPGGMTVDNKRTEIPYFTGKMCYDLRCAFLHSGNSHIKDFGEIEDADYNYTYHFELLVNGSDSFGQQWMEPQPYNTKICKDRIVRINVELLCENLCCSAEKYYNSKPKELFKEHSIQIVDINEEQEKIKGLYKYNVIN